MSDTGSLPPIDPASAEAARRAAEDETRREAERQGSSGLAEVAEGAVDVLDIAGTVMDGVVSVAGTVVDGAVSVAGTVVEGVTSAIGGLLDL